MRGIRRMVMAGLVLLGSVGFAQAQATAETSAAAAALAAVLGPKAEGVAPRFIAAADPSAPDRFVAAMLIPGIQLIVVASDYQVPVLLRERIVTGKYQDAYLDLSSATDAGTRLTIEDIQADGLAIKPPKGVASGDLVVRGGEELRFDGQWRKKRMKEDAYKAAFATASDDYVRLIGLLVAQAKQ